MSRKLQRLQGSLSQRVALIAITLAAIGAAFPVAMASKTVSFGLYCLASTIALAAAVSRLSLLMRPLLISFILFVASFAAPFDVAIVTHCPLGVEWRRFQDLDPWDYSLSGPKAGTSNPVPTDLPQIIGVRPRWILRVCFP